MDKTQIKIWLDEQRLKKNWTQREAGERAGIGGKNTPPATAWGMAVDQNREVSVQRLSQMAKIFGYKIGYKLEKDK